MNEQNSALVQELQAKDRRIRDLESALIEAGQAVVKQLLAAKTREERRQWRETLDQINRVLKDPLQ